MTPTVVGPEDEDSQPITFPYDKAGYAEVVKDALAEEGKVKGNELFQNHDYDCSFHK